jgi:hypothetical protein
MVVGKALESNGRIIDPRHCKPPAVGDPPATDSFGICKACLNEALSPSECVAPLDICKQLAIDISKGADIARDPSVKLCKPYTDTIIPFTTARKVVSGLSS